MLTADAQVRGKMGREVGRKWGSEISTSSAVSQPKQAKERKTRA